ncbi:MAG TPA: fibronectin type III domain-containing protein, partial [Vicinamibacterales bacterium]
MSILAVVPTTASAGGHGDNKSRKPKQVEAPPAQPPVKVAAQGSTSRVVVEWAPVKGATHYRIFRGIAGVWTPDPIATVWRLRFVDHSVRQGAVHAYKVAAVNRGGLGPQSGEVSATPIAPPTGVTAVGGERQVTVKWAASAGATGYTVFRGLNWEHLQPVAKNISATMFVDTGLTNGKRYVYRVRALALNSESRLSHAAVAKPLGVPPAVAPANLQASSGNAFIQLSWNAVTGATGYSVFRSTNGGAFGATPVTTVTNPSFKNSGLTNGVAYSYRVAARNGAGDGPQSEPVTATPNAPPVAPTNLSATGGNAMVTLSWTAVTGATSYRLYRGTATNGQAAAPLATNLTTAAFVDSAVTNGTAYFYKVTSVAGSGESVRSTEATATPTA